MSSITVVEGPMISAGATGPGGQAIRHMIVRYEGPLLGYVRRHIRCSREDAEEIVLDTFVAAFQLAPTFRGSCSVLTWLCSLARFKIRDRLRALERKKVIPRGSAMSLDGPPPDLRKTVALLTAESIEDRIDRMGAVETLLSALSPEQRLAVALRYLEGLSVREVARRMGRSEKAVERLLERAKDRSRSAPAQ